MSLYESVFITPVDTSDAALNELIEKFKEVIISAGGQVTTVDKWGRKRLAYPIRGNHHGIYLRFEFNGPSNLPQILNKAYLVNDKVIRHLTIKLDEKVKAAMTERKESKPPDKEKEIATEVPK